MKNKIYIAIICAFSIVFAVSSGFLIKHYCDSAKQAEMYDNLIEVVETEPEETTEPMNYSEEKTFIPEYQELYLQNNDMVGWIKVGYLNQSFQNAVMEGVLYGCEQGLYGWKVTDCKICFEYGLYYSPVSTPADFRLLSPIVLEQALKKAGTELLEPYV